MKLCATVKAKKKSEVVQENKTETEDKKCNVYILFCSIDEHVRSRKQRTIK